MLARGHSLGATSSRDQRGALCRELPGVPASRCSLGHRTAGCLSCIAEGLETTEGREKIKKETN
jgi:hypothetical protein